MVAYTVLLKANMSLLLKLFQRKVVYPLIFMYRKIQQGIWKGGWLVKLQMH